MDSAKGANEFEDGWGVRCRPDGVYFTVEVRPGRPRDDFFVEEGSVRVHVRAAPEKGAANAAVEELLGARLGEAGEASIVSGMTSKTKMVRVRGGDPQLVMKRVLKILRAVRRG